MLRVLVAVCVAWVGFAAHAAEIGEKFTLTHDKQEREYHLFVPAGDTKKERPLVVVLHGGGGNPQNVADTTGFSELAAKEGFLVAYPAGMGRIPTWNAGKCCGYAQRRNIDDVGFIEKMVAEIKTKHAIDSTRVYATGMSNGGMMSYRLGCELSSLFAAIAPVAGAMNVFSCQPDGRPSVFAVHALDDKHVLYNGGVSQQGVRAMAGKKPESDASVGEAMQFWTKANYCRKFPGTENLGEVTRVRYYCAEGRHVVMNTVSGGGHSWPGGKKPREAADTPTKHFDATGEIWKFFRQHPPTELF